MAQFIKTALGTATAHSSKLFHPSEVLPVFRRHLITSTASSTSQAKPALDFETRLDMETKWLFPVYREMELMAVGHKHNALMTGGCYRYNTVKPLKQEHVERALYHLQRKIPNFLCYIKERGDQLWVCEHPEPEIDFKVLNGVDGMDVVNHFSNTPVDYENAPLWKTRLVPVSDEVPSLLPEIKAAFPYQYDFIFSPHHSFIDGFTMAFTTQKLVELLNDVIAGRPIDDSKPFAKFVSNADVVELDRKVMQELKHNPEKVEAMKKELLACDKSPVLFKAFPPPGGVPLTKHVTQDIKLQTLKQFTANCKKAGITFNSGLEALINIALVEMVRDAGVTDESHDISINLATDMRRYMKQRPLPVVGLHVRPIAHRVETNKYARDNFWEYSSNLHSKVKNLIKSGDPLYQYNVRQMVMPQISVEEHYKNNVRVIRDYGLSNIGDITKILPGEGDHLQQTDLIMYTGVQQSMFMMLHQIYTFRGHTPYSISYDTSYMSDDTANLLMERVMHLLNHFSQ